MLGGAGDRSFAHANLLTHAHQSERSSFIVVRALVMLLGGSFPPCHVLPSPPNDCHSPFVTADVFAVFMTNWLF